MADGSLALRAEVVETADVLFNAVAWPYVHLRGRHGWDSERARTRLVDLAMSWVTGIASR